MTEKMLESRTARAKWRDTLDSAITGEVDVIITRHGKPVTAMIRYEDYLVLREELLRLRAKKNESYRTMLASESVLSREWDSPVEDEAWADL